MTTLIAKATLMMLSYEVRNFDSAAAEYVQVVDWNTFMGEESPACASGEMVDTGDFGRLLV